MSEQAERTPQAVPLTDLDALLTIHNEDVADAYARGLQTGAVAMFAGWVVSGLILTAVWSFVR